MPAAKFLPCGDTALTVEFGNRVDRQLSASVLGLSRRIHEAQLEGVVETVPAFASLLIHYDPLKTSAARICEQIEALLETSDADQGSGRLWRIPACYEGELAPDLDSVANHTGLTPSEVVAGHTAQRYHVYMLGFLPGYPYMGDLPESLQLPRREDPRTAVPAGSVAIATNMTAVYTFECPGGWHLIGRTPIPLFDIGNEAPALLRPGDSVRFEVISRVEYDRLCAAVAKREFVVAPERAA